MKLLITGAGGFLGSHLVSAALRHWPHEIIAVCNYHGDWDTGLCPVNPRVRIERLDIRDTQAIARLKPDAIINAAARVSVPYSHAMQSDYFEVNAGAVQRMLAALPGVRFVQISTSEVFDGQTPPYFPSSRPNPVTPYGASKLAAEAVVMASGNTVCRVFNLFGPGQSPRAVIPRMAVQAWRVKHGEQGCVKLYGPRNSSGEHYSRAFVYAPAVAETVVTRVLDDPANLVQLASTEPLRIADLWLRVAEIVGVNEIEWTPLPENATAVWKLYGTSSAKYEARQLDDVTLANTVHWYEDRRNDWKNVSYD